MRNNWMTVPKTFKRYSQSQWPIICCNSPSKFQLISVSIRVFYVNCWVEVENKLVSQAFPRDKLLPEYITHSGRANIAKKDPSFTSVKLPYLQQNELVKMKFNIQCRLTTKPG